MIQTKMRQEYLEDNVIYEVADTTLVLVDDDIGTGGDPDF